MNSLLCRSIGRITVNFGGIEVVFDCFALNLLPIMERKRPEIVKVGIHGRQR